ncbi:uncharacterized protein MYCGRDRAFT_97956 [Zymoseptoria tritici IPO323]|uniref:Uncharacterized protein n=1 Tax=Zymoseptoria tritici (strain CBS 115943 / IPO323) TaxID=336722 RepID=F9XRW2_ZYMTI|nr:uncharacterized protein MYCGRDRAFT_97956 [Zymoseptoria tritici IPO323]EGP81985.1 hypothetical protein MYCGRDRAFT_97956 [Zymoseptoria tritici IPO323]
MAASDSAAAPAVSCTAAASLLFFIVALILACFAGTSIATFFTSVVGGIIVAAVWLVLFFVVDHVILYQIGEFYQKGRTCVMYGGLSAGRELVMPKAMTTQATVFWPTVVGSRVSDLGLRQQIVCVVHACGYRVMKMQASHPSVRARQTTSRRTVAAAVLSIVLIIAVAGIFISPWYASAIAAFAVADLVRSRVASTIAASAFEDALTEGC